MKAAAYEVRLAKADFKFSSAHFTIFGPEDAEPLHGHNYRVELELVGQELDELGLLFDFDVVKKAIRARCARLDSKTLLPRDNPHLRLVESGEEIEAYYSTRRYVLPSSEAIVMPVSNITIEELAAFLWRSLVADLCLTRGAPARGLARLNELAILIEETDGQSCLYRAELNGQL